MKLKRLALVITVSTLAAGTVFSQQGISAEDKKNISDGLTDFSHVLLKAIPEAATQQNVWSDSHIGNIYPSGIPHFGGGLTFGGTLIDTTGLKNAGSIIMKEFSDSLENSLTSAAGVPVTVTSQIGLTVPDKFVLPTATADLRIGGLVLPFDIGICAMMTNPGLFSVDLSDPESIRKMSRGINFNIMETNFSADYLALGLDARYRLAEESMFVPSVSLGGGYFITKGAFKVDSVSSKSLGEINGKNYGTQITEAGIGISYETEVFFLQGQASKNFGFITAFGGARALVSRTSTSWEWNYNSKNDDPALVALLSSSDGDSGIMVNDTASGVYSGDGKFDFSGIQPQLFAGCSFNFLCFQTGVSICADVRSFFDSSYEQRFIWSGALSFHAKL